jgi:hypothetical protein
VSRRRRVLLSMGALGALLSIGAAACSATNGASTGAMAEMAGMSGAASSSADLAQGVGGLGLTRVGTTPSYIVVLNVVPPEHMYMPAEAGSMHPTEGEYILDGEMAAIGPESRHTEVHIYSKDTGKPVTDIVPVITLRDDTDGTSVRPQATLMQDVLIGPRDIHFGNNVTIKAGHQFSVVVDIAQEEVSFSGRLS